LVAHRNFADDALGDLQQIRETEVLDPSVLGTHRLDAARFAGPQPW